MANSITIEEYNCIKSKIIDNISYLNLVKQVRNPDKEKCYLTTMVTEAGRYFTVCFKTDNFFKQYTWIRKLHPKSHLVSYHIVGEEEFKELSLLDSIESQLELEKFEVTHIVFR